MDKNFTIIENEKELDTVQINNDVEVNPNQINNNVEVGTSAESCTAYTKVKTLKNMTMGDLKTMTMADLLYISNK